MKAEHPATRFRVLRRMGSRGAGFQPAKNVRKTAGYKPAPRQNQVTLALLVLLAAATTAPAQMRSVVYDLTKLDPGAYTTNIPASAFTPTGLKLSVTPDVTYTFDAKEFFSGEYNFDVKADVVKRSGEGAIHVEMLLINETERREARAVYRHTDTTPTGYRCTLQYLKDGKATSGPYGEGTTDISAAHGQSGPIDLFRVYVADKRVFFLQKSGSHPYQWRMVDYPLPTYFNEDCDSFRPVLRIHCDKGVAAEVHVAKMAVTGPCAVARDEKRRTFLFDFGPINQEIEDDFVPVTRYTDYSSDKGYGWIHPEPEKLWRPPIPHYKSDIPLLADEVINQVGYSPIPLDRAGWYQSWLRASYWLQHHDKRYFYAINHGGSYVEFFKKYLDLNTPLERDHVGMARPYHWAIDETYREDVEERRGSRYIDDDLDTQFAVDVPNGRYNMILGLGFSTSWQAGGEGLRFHVEVEDRVRKQNVGTSWRRPYQHPIKNVIVEDGQINIRLFADVRKAMDKYRNYEVGTGWMISYLVILPTEEKEAMSEWEWRIIKRRGEVIRRVTFVKGDPAETKLQTQEPETRTGFLTLNGKPLYFLKLQHHYVPGCTEHFGYYCLNNMLHCYQTVKGSQHFFKPDWEKLSYADDYPWQTIDRMNMTYTWGYLNSIHQENILSFVPHAVSGEGTPTMDSRGRRNRYNIQPPLNSALGKEIQREAYTMVSNQLKEHPSLAAHYLFEELWHPDNDGYDDQSLIQYWEWLRRKYTTIEALNAEWGREYKGFEDIVQPVRGEASFWTHTPEFVNFRKFRGWAQNQMIKSAGELVAKLEPEHISWAAKGDYATQTYQPGEFMDMFGWYSPYLAASVARQFNKAAIVGGYHLNCEFAYIDGRRQHNHKPGEQRWLGKGEYDIYNRLISRVFKGTKGFYVEWYTDGMCHVFHRTDLVRRDGPKFKVKHWTGQIAFFEDEAYEGPPVKFNRAALQASAANKMLHRTGQLWLPAAPIKPKVLFPITEASCFLDFFETRPYADLESVSLRVLRSSNLAADFLHISTVKDLSQYSLIVMTDLTTSITRRDADRVRQFVADGGKLILVNAAGFSDEDRPRRFTGDRDENAVFPLEEFADLGGYRIKADNMWHMSVGATPVRFTQHDLAGALAGKELGDWDLKYFYIPQPGSTVFLEGTLTKTSRAAKAGQTVALGILNKDRNVAIVHMPPKTAPDEQVRPISQFFRKLIDTWRPDDRIEMAGIDDAWDVYAGRMDGDGYTLAAVANNNADETRKLALKLRGLSAGEYAVIDITGQRPVVNTRSDGGLELDKQPATLRTSIAHRLTARQLTEAGIPCELPPRQARVLLLRPTAQNVWISMWKPSLVGFVKRPITVAHGTAPEDKAGAAAIRVALARAGVAATITPAADVKLKKLRHEVRVNSVGGRKEPNDDTSSWHLMDVFANEVIDSDNSFIVVGSEATNRLTKHLGAPDSFAYDKLLEKITPAYPGQGRGVIAWVDAVNYPTYDLRSQARDAIIVGGSDAAGTNAAVAELVKLIGKYCPAER